MPATRSDAFKESLLPSQRWELTTLEHMRAIIDATIDCAHLMPAFLSAGIVSIEDKRNINRPGSTKSERNDLFLDHICTGGFIAGETTAYQCLMKYLIDKNAYPALRTSLQNELEKIRCADLPPPVAIRVQSTNEPDDDFRPGYKSGNNSSSTGSWQSNSTSTGASSPTSSSVMSSEILTADDSFSPGTRSGPNSSAQSLPEPIEASTPITNAHRKDRNRTSGHVDTSEHILAAAHIATPSGLNTSGLSTQEHTLRPGFSPARRATGRTGYPTATLGSLITKESISARESDDSLRSNTSSNQVFPADANGTPAFTEERLLGQSFQPSKQSTISQATQ